MLRVEVRTESPPDLPQRSGAVVLDLHEIEVELRDSPPNPTPPKRARFPGPSGKTLQDIAATSLRAFPLGPGNRALLGGVGSGGESRNSTSISCRSNTTAPERCGRSGGDSVRTSTRSIGHLSSS